MPEEEKKPAVPSDNLSQDRQQALPFGAGILPDDQGQPEEALSAESAPDVSDPKPAEAEDAAEEVGHGDSDDAAETRESPAQAEPEDLDDGNEPAAEEPEEAPIQEFKIIDPPNYKDEEKAFAQLLPGPKEEVRFDEQPRRRPRRARQKRGEPERRGRAQRKPAQPVSLWTKILRWISGLFGKRN